jgi:hypothetical protein
MSLQVRMMRTLRQDVQSMHAYAVQPSAGMGKGRRQRLTNTGTCPYSVHAIDANMAY